jgi:hypothetical protein
VTLLQTVIEAHRFSGFVGSSQKFSSDSAGTGKPRSNKKRWLRRNGTSRVPYEKIALLDSKKYRRARLEVPDISFTRVYRTSNPPLCGRCGRRIEGEQYHRHTNVTTPSISPYDDGFAGTGRGKFMAD